MTLKVKKIVLGALVAASIGIYAVAGYRVGEAKGRGWRGAVIGHRCQVSCPDPSGFVP